MSLDGAYDHDNIFAKIVRGEISATKVFEDENTLAFMDVFPQARGHTLVVHKNATARNLIEIDPGQLGVLVTTVQRVAGAVREAMKADGVMIAQFNGAAAGQTVYHLHFHVIPRWEGHALGRHGDGGPADANELAEIASLISARLA